MTTSTRTGSFIDFMLGFDHGWDHAKYGDRPDALIPTASYLAGWLAGAARFADQADELEEAIR